MNKILLSIFCTLILISAANAQALNVSKSVEPNEVLVGGEALIAISIQSNESQRLRITDRMPSAFDVVSFNPSNICTLEVQALTNARIIRCELVSLPSDRITYAVKANEGGVYFLPEIVIVTENGSEVRSRSNAMLVVGVPEPLPPTTSPPPLTVPPRKAPSLTSKLFEVVRFVQNIITAIFPEPIRLILLSLILFLVLLLILVVPFYILLRKG